VSEAKESVRRRFPTNYAQMFFQPTQLPFALPTQRFLSESVLDLYACAQVLFSFSTPASNSSPSPASNASASISDFKLIHYRQASKSREVQRIRKRGASASLSPTARGNRLRARRASQSRCQPHHKRESQCHVSGCKTLRSRLGCRFVMIAIPQPTKWQRIGN
jgi:hypothetical protein